MDLTYRSADRSVRVGGVRVNSLVGIAVPKDDERGKVKRENRGGEDPETKDS